MLAQLSLFLKGFCGDFGGVGEPQTRPAEFSNKGLPRAGDDLRICQFRYSQIVICGLVHIQTASRSLYVIHSGDLL
jgi:hypothetical protein